MDFLLNLLQEGASEKGQNFTVLGLAFRGLFPVWLGITLFVIFSAGVLALYITERGKFSWVGRIGLAGVRMLFLALLLFLLIRPSLRVQFEIVTPRPIPVLVDVSDSMTYADLRQTDQDKELALWALGVRPGDKNYEKELKDFKSASRLELVRSSLEGSRGKYLDDLQTKGPVQPYLFGSHLRGAGPQDVKARIPSEVLAKSLKELADRRAEKKPDSAESAPVYDATTALADAVKEIVDRKTDSLPAAIVLVTDGQENASRRNLQEVADLCIQKNIPLHIYGVGSTQGVALKLHDVDVPETIFAGDKISLPIRYAAHGLAKDSKITVTVKLGDKTEVREFDVKLGDDVVNTFEFDVAKGEDTRDLKVSIAHGPTALKDEMKHPAPLRVLDAQIKVLYIEHAPRFEYRFLHSLLTRGEEEKDENKATKRSKRFDPTILLVNADPDIFKKSAANKGQKSEFIEKFPKEKDFWDAKYNLIILGDVSSTYLGKDNMKLIKQFIDKQGGLIVISGRQHMPSTYADTPIAEILPIEFEAPKEKPSMEKPSLGYPISLTMLGQGRSMLMLEDTIEENKKTWETLPGFYWSAPMTKLKAQAEVLIVNPKAKLGEDPLPLLVMQRPSRGDVLFFATDETWRWRAVKENKYFGRFWRQILYQMGGASLAGDTLQRARIELAGGRALLGELTPVYAQLLDKDYKPVDLKEIVADVVSLPKGNVTATIVLHPVDKKNQPGKYVGQLTNEQSGSFELRLKDEDKSVLAYRVQTPPGHELSESALNEKVLRTLAQSTGGRFYRETDLPSLAEHVAVQTVTSVQRPELLLWHPLLLVLFLSLLTIEWVGRKFANLS